MPDDTPSTINKTYALGDTAQCRLCFSLVHLTTIGWEDNRGRYGCPDSPTHPFGHIPR